jgi:hypothetical protein
MLHVFYLYFIKTKFFPVTYQSVLRIHDILVCMWIRIYYASDLWIRVWIQILLFLSLIFKVPTRNKFYRQHLCGGQCSQEQSRPQQHMWKSKLFVIFPAEFTTAQSLHFQHLMWTEVMSSRRLL